MLDELSEALAFQHLQMHARLDAGGQRGIRSSGQGLYEVRVADESDREQITAVESKVQERLRIDAQGRGRTPPIGRLRGRRSKISTACSG